MFRDYKGDNMLWDPIHKVWVLIDFGITQLRDFTKEAFKGGYTPGACWGLNLRVCENACVMCATQRM
jgi:hypothetical protein